MSNRRQLPAAYSYYVLLCSAMFGLLISVVIVRADIVHFMYLAPLWYVLLAWILDRHELRSRLLDAIRPYLLMFVAAAFGLMAIAVLVTAVGASGWIETRRGWITTGGQDTVIEYVQAHTSAGATILVHPYLPLYYYLTATQSPSRYDYVQPGLTTPEQFQEVLDSLQSQRIEPALFEPGFTEKIAHSWPATPLAAIAHDPVADYIARHYRLCAVLNSAANWQFEYMVRREATCR